MIGNDVILAVRMLKSEWKFYFKHLRLDGNELWKLKNSSAKLEIQYCQIEWTNTLSRESQRISDFS